jgi:gamma-glutamylcyclotransferase (GGCT)/AIG2-like uncharacterized protein YtfP
MAQLDTPLFVYGSLLLGQESDGYLGGLERWPARIQGALYRLPAGYPALVVRKGIVPSADWVVGEVVALDHPGRLKVLDMFEGMGRGLFQRGLHQIQSGQRRVHAWAYTMTAQQVRALKGRPLKGGDWRRVSPTRRRRG